MEKSPFVMPHQTYKFEDKEGAGYTPREYFDRIQEINNSAARCVNKKLSESSWNSEVHARLLYLATSRIPGLDYVDATSATISDKSLLPTQVQATGFSSVGNDDSIPCRGQASKRVPIGSKMVDYCLTMADLEVSVESYLKYSPILSINHTSAPYLHFEPIAVSIDTKRAAIGEDEGNNQLAVWVCAQFNHLRILSATTDEPPPPCLLIHTHGHDWKMLVADCSVGGRIMILRYHNLGQTNTIVGICKILESLRKIGEYVEDVYKPWFRKNVLK